MKFFSELFDWIINPTEDELNETFDKTVFIYLTTDQYIMFKKCDSDIFYPILENYDNFHIEENGKFFKIFCSHRVSMSIIQRLSWQCNVMIL